LLSFLSSFTQIVFYPDSSRWTYRSTKLYCVFSQTSSLSLQF
jgi:hypothetical protein